MLWQLLPARSKVPPIPAVSIGSIAVGGTAKTPLTIYLAEKLGAKLRICVISRGWRRRSQQKVLLVSDGRQILCSPQEAGDEPYMIAKRLPNATVVVSKDRNLGIRRALESADLDMAILDDALQYRGIVKAIEIVSIDERVVTGNPHLVPLGILRQPLRSIQPQNPVVLFDNDAKLDPSTIDALAMRFKVFKGEVQAIIVDGCDLSETVSELLKDQSILAISGIANPARFENTCLKMGITPKVSIRLDDHTWYDSKTVKSIIEIMKSKKCESIITTEKDIYKMPTSLRRLSFVIKISVKVCQESDLLNLITKAIGKYEC